MSKQFVGGRWRRWMSGLAVGALVLGLVQTPAMAADGDLEADLPIVAAWVVPEVVDGDSLLLRYEDRALVQHYQRSVDGGQSWSSATLPVDCGPDLDFLSPENGVVVEWCRGDNQVAAAYSLSEGNQIGDSLSVSYPDEIIAGRGSRVLGATYGQGSTEYWVQDLAVEGSTKQVFATSDVRLEALTADGAIGIDRHYDEGTATTTYSVVKFVVGQNAGIALKTYPAGVEISGLRVRGGVAYVQYTDTGSSGFCYLNLADSQIGACISAGSDDFGIYRATEAGLLVSDYDRGALTWNPVSGSGWGEPVVVGADEVWAAGAQSSGQPMVVLGPGHDSKLYRVLPNGNLEELFSVNWLVTAELTGLSLAANAVISADQTGVWSRSVGSSIGDQVSVAGLSGNRASAFASAARWVVTTRENAQDDVSLSTFVFDNGVATRNVTGPDYYSPRALSGPHLLVDRSYVPQSATEPVEVTEVEVPGAAPRLAERGRDVFGSLLLADTEGSNAKYKVTDLTGASDPVDVEIDIPSGLESWDFYEQQIWGDWIGGSFWSESSDGSSSYQVLVRNYRTNEQKLREGAFLALGDGFVIFRNYTTRAVEAWDFVNDVTVTLGVWNEQNLVAVDGNRVAYPDYVAGKLRVKTLGSGFATSAPRSLGVVAAASFDLGASWVADIDLSKPVAAGELEIRDSAGVLVRSLAASASASGSLRGITWDGKDSSGAYVSGGTYSFKLTNAAADGSGTVKAVDGTDRALGTVTFKVPEITAVTPVISGAATVGSKLVAAPGVWGPQGITLAYQWLRDGAVIAGATAATYTLVEADLNHNVSVRVRGSLAVPVVSVERTSTTVKVAAGKLTATPVPTVRGASVFDSTLTAVPGVWAPAPVSLSYEWLRDGKVIAGATKVSYRLTVSDVAHRVSVRVTGTKAGYGAASAQSVAQVVALAKFTKVTTPTISGTAKVGKTVTAKVSAWAPTATFTYQWLRNGKAISKATKSAYKLTKSDKGKKISVKITGNRAGFASVVKTSKTTSKVK